MNIPSEHESKSCKIKMIPGTDIVECLESMDCDWCMKFGEGKFCIYQSRLGALNSGMAAQSSRRGVAQ